MTVTFTCPRCNKRVSASDAYASESIYCEHCGAGFTAPRSPSLPPPNPYEAPPILDVDSPPTGIGSEVSGTPIALAILIGLCGVHVLLNIAVFYLGTTTGNVNAIFGGFASCGIYAAILIGLVNKQEWARLFVIWMSYVAIVASVFASASPAVPTLQVLTSVLVFVPLGISTLVYAHWPSARRATKGASTATAYTYHENANDEGGPT